MHGMNREELAKLESLIRENERLKQQIKQQAEQIKQLEQALIDSRKG